MPSAEKVSSSPRLGEPVKEVDKIKVCRHQKWHTKVEGNMRVSLAERPNSENRQRVSDFQGGRILLSGL
jgi:hypothetical protein